MPNFYDRTAMGGPEVSFTTTTWTKILSARTSDDERQRLIINNLLSKYWKPVYCYLRSRGYDNDKSKDLTQGFFHEIVLGRKLIQKADQSQGKFRTFLLAALDHYLVDVHREETANKRHPKGAILALQDYDLPEIPSNSPEQGFNYAWITDILDQVLMEVKKECYKTGKETHWLVFCGRLLNPIMNGDEPLSLSRLCSMYGIEDESRASNMAITVKRRLRKTLERRIRQLGHCDSEIDTEIFELITFFSKNSAG